eukprot:TRINITY_DN10851_c0_g1_i4.p1 TRINITY_DN10851_c0_g1~~TRINITY_DN10851_c0_g1_i4.p1  ORF type:complete len:149 (-),score=29.69 TRINITY_DN10851_c0_g1_i4:84-530(-)
MIRRPPRSTLSSSSAASDVYKRQEWKGQSLHLDRVAACGESWSPDTLSGQCFGLGDRQKISPDTAEGCRDACCNAVSPTCQTWQFRKDKGCFYGPGQTEAASCEKSVFKAFRGRRKLMPGRKYEPPARSEQRFAGWDKAKLSKGYKRN